ncbi:MAG: carboxypeptidase-like regulatory domain-containing protein [Planctomycetaceae bacterium]|jgi:hypothetical protein|nr:carboxypeptidase-like regulatory domain-containing protein [Planctomycetaceae bacterium]
MKKFNPTFLIVFVSVVLLSGCLQNNGAKVVPASGIITQNGKPLTDVRIEFSRMDTGALSFAETDAEGRFTLTHTHGKSGAEPGKYRVSIFQKGKPIPLPAGKKPEDIPEEQRNRTTPEVPLTMSDKKPLEVEISEKGDSNIVIDLQ